MVKYYAFQESKMPYTLCVENIKCGGCAHTITSKLEALESIEQVSVDIEKGEVTINGDEAQRENVLAALLKMGYPETGTAEGIAAAKARAKSFVSCAVGKMNS